MHCPTIQAVIQWLLTVVAQVQSQAGPCEIYGGQYGTGTVAVGSDKLWLLYKLKALVQ